jgi:Fe-S-cluster containining protein
MNEELRKIMEGQDNSVIRAFLQGEEVKEGDPLAFKCRKCGKCCHDSDTLLVAPEFARIMWFMYRTGMPLQRIGNPFPGGSTGLPIMNLKKRAQMVGGVEKQVCIFLSPTFRRNPAGKLEESGKWMCDIYPERPSVCRAYPLGRTIALPGMQKLGLEMENHYCITNRCPGFDVPRAEEENEGAPSVSGESPLTVKQWFEKNINPDMAEERMYYLTQVVPAWMKGKSRRNGDGSESNQHDPMEDAPFFFKPPAPPDDQKDDHKTIMQWLKALATMPGLFKKGSEMVRMIKESEGRSATTQEVDRVVGFVNQTLRNIVKTGDVPEFIKSENEKSA